MPWGNCLVQRFGRVLGRIAVSVPVTVPKRSGKHLLRRFGQSGIRNWESYSSNSTTSPILAHNVPYFGPRARPSRQVFLRRTAGGLERLGMTWTRMDMAAPGT